MDKHFIVNDRCVTTDNTLLIADNGDYTAVFTTDQEWRGKYVTARFCAATGLYEDRELDDNMSCQIPASVLTGSTLYIGLHSGDMATMPCRVQIQRSIKSRCEPMPPPTDDVYDRIQAAIAHIKDTAEIKVVVLDGADIALEAAPNTYYICGELTSLTLTPPASGIMGIKFKSGDSATALTLLGDVMMPDGFAVLPDRTYELNILNGLGVAQTWIL